MTLRSARITATVLLIALFFGTLMPGSWKDGALLPWHSPIDLAVLAHITIFTAIAFMIPQTRWWTVTWWQVPALGLALALLTEGLQFFAIDRHPNLAGVVQDVAGTLMGWYIGARVSRARYSAKVSSP